MIHPVGIADRYRGTIRRAIRCLGLSRKATSRGGAYSAASRSSHGSTSRQSASRGKAKLTARMLVLGGVAADRADGDRRARAAIESGAGLEKFRQIIETQGGDPKVVDDYDRLPHVGADGRHLLAAPRAGFVTAIDAELVGRASVVLGAGRDRVEDPVDPAVGILVKAVPGDEVRAGDPLLELHYRDHAKLEAALTLAGRAVAIGDERPAPRPLIVGEVR